MQERNTQRKNVFTTKQKNTKIGPGQSGPHTDCICSMVLKGCP